MAEPRKTKFEKFTEDVLQNIAELKESVKILETKKDNLSPNDTEKYKLLVEQYEGKVTKAQEKIAELEGSLAEATKTVQSSGGLFNFLFGKCD